MGKAGARPYPARREMRRAPERRWSLRTHLSILATDFRPSFPKIVALGKQRAQGMPGARCTRSLVYE